MLKRALISLSVQQKLLLIIYTSRELKQGNIWSDLELELYRIYQNDFNKILCTIKHETNIKYEVEQ
jgi:hypothetical protein